CLQYNSVPFTF
nr:immunoglobulin light chain junction region [Macaca mulatta]MOW62176.1 immunoglobulin light chain junction region [Macaca mulatta]MOW62331.1 immunoglobulin light chain junction region [Macaca mulatta]MOW62379.1 immunoglobulin light chain junction region [Macaca mulatta]MOW62667.1 immunoglobulin light chain junction region [Macaca mulatta]